jgi:hypothetical protein
MRYLFKGAYTKKDVKQYIRYLSEGIRLSKPGLLQLLTEKATSLGCYANAECPSGEAPADLWGGR